MRENWNKTKVSEFFAKDAEHISDNFCYIKEIFYEVSHIADMVIMSRKTFESS